MVNRSRNALQALLDGLFPSYCELCDLATTGALPLCEDCRGELPLNRPACPRCALPVPASVLPGTLCGQCLAAAPPFTHTLAPYLYEEYLAFLVARWKYQRQPQLSALLADLWLAVAAPATDIDLLVPVPLHWRRAWRRGYNQAALLCDELLQRRPAHPSSAAREPPVEILLDVDREYRERAARGELRKIAPRRFNPEGRSWLPILHAQRGDWQLTALFSNTARAHELGRTRDWVVLYYHSDHDAERQCTVVTETHGRRKGQRVVRGREAEC